MKKCNNCGQENFPANKYCSSCGQIIEKKGFFKKKELPTITARLPDEKKIATADLSKTIEKNLLGKIIESEPKEEEIDEEQDVKEEPEEEQEMPATTKIIQDHERQIKELQNKLNENVKAIEIIASELKWLVDNNLNWANGYLQKEQRK